MNFNKLIYLREEKELSQRQIADILNVSKSQYARWETMEQIIPLSHLNNICNLFKYSMDYITGIKNINNYANYNTELSKTTIGLRLKIFRNNNNLSQSELAKILNTSQSTISAYENGKTMLLTVFAIQICENYNLSLDWLCGRIN